MLKVREKSSNYNVQDEKIISQSCSSQNFTPKGDLFETQFSKYHSFELIVDKFYAAEPNFLRSNESQTFRSTNNL